MMRARRDIKEKIATKKPQMWRLKPLPSAESGHQWLGLRVYTLNLLFTYQQH